MCVNAPVLAYNDKTKPIVLTIDSSSKGLGAAIMQEGKPVAYTPCALTETQQSYSQIERDTCYYLWLFKVKQFHFWSTCDC